MTLVEKILQRIQRAGKPSIAAIAKENDVAYAKLVADLKKIDDKKPR